MMHKFFKIAGGCFLLAGCGAVIGSSTQRVEFVTPGIIGADCRAENANYAYQMYTPDITTLERSYLPLTVTCRAEGYLTEIIEVPVEINNASFLNVLNGIVPGVTYDAATRTLPAYPDRVEIVMTPVVKEAETVVPLYDAPSAKPLYELPPKPLADIPPPVPYQADSAAETSLTGVK